jgi:glycosyltransferase involved in cell wall biosynthesis
LEDGEHLLMANQPEIFAEKVIWLLENPGLAQKMAQKGRSLVERSYDWRKIVSQFDEYISQVASK